MKFVPLFGLEPMQLTCANYFSAVAVGCWHVSVLFSHHVHPRIAHAHCGAALRTAALHKETRVGCGYQNCTR